jgi:uncharacterized heparinase superfamily protein
MLTKLLLLFNTVKYLKPIQVFYQLWYRFKPRQKLNCPKTLPKDYKIKKLSFCPVFVKDCANADNRFRFLNLEVQFDKTIDWNYQDNGKLWNYNLQYFNYLNQNNVGDETKAAWLNDFDSWLGTGKVGLEPYPVSLRIINVIRFLNDKDPKDFINAFRSIFTQLTYLENNLEFHIMGNHLLENIFALHAGGAFFQNKRWSVLAEKLLIEQLTEQTTNDGAHFELSPMYHQIMLFRVLEAYSIAQSYEMEEFLGSKAKLMLRWLNTISFSDGSIPLFNDSANEIALSTHEINVIAAELGLLDSADAKLSDSGYRIFFSNEFELVVDINGISPSYQPGHAHADTFSFELHWNGLPIIVDTGTSSYILSDRRKWERCTKAHNTVTVNGLNSSELWGSHRVGRRARVEILEDSAFAFDGFHDGYKVHNASHRRSFVIGSERELKISDWIVPIRPASEVSPRLDVRAKIHFHPDVKIQLEGDILQLNDKIKIFFKGAQYITLNDYLYAPEFNKLVNAKFVEIIFQNQLTSHILFE